MKISKIPILWDVVKKHKEGKIFKDIEKDLKIKNSKPQIQKLRDIFELNNSEANKIITAWKVFNKDYWNYILTENTVNNTWWYKNEKILKENIIKNITNELLIKNAFTKYNKPDITINNTNLISFPYMESAYLILKNFWQKFGLEYLDKFPYEKIEELEDWLRIIRNKMPYNADKETKKYKFSTAHLDNLNNEYIKNVIVNTKEDEVDGRISISFWELSLVYNDLFKMEIKNGDIEKIDMEKIKNDVKQKYTKKDNKSDTWWFDYKSLLA